MMCMCLLVKKTIFKRIILVVHVYKWFFFKVPSTTTWTMEDNSISKYC